MLGVTKLNNRKNFKSYYLKPVQNVCVCVFTNINGEIERTYKENHPRFFVPYINGFKSYVNHILTKVQRKN